MSDRQVPAVSRHKLRHDLRVLRESAGLTQSDVAAQFDWSVSKLVRIENGQVGISVPDLQALCRLYDAPADKTASLVLLARKARRGSWWTPYREVLPPQLQQFLGYEADAARILLFQPCVLPGLLQVEGYIREVVNTLSLDQYDAATAEQLVEVRLRRQREVLQGDHRPTVQVVVDEAVLHRRIGGAPVMASQLQHLANLASDGGIELGIVPFDVGAYFGMTGGFHVMDFSDGDTSDAVLYLENAQLSLALRDKPELVAQYRKHFERMFGLSYRGDQAMELLQRILREVEHPDQQGGARFRSAPAEDQQTP